MSDLLNYDEAIAALLAYDESNDPSRAALLRNLFAAQRLFFRGLQESIAVNGQSVERLADRVQNHISPQLIDIADAQEQARKTQTVILQRLGAQDAIQQATHDNVIDIAQMLRGRQVRE